tara:strand:- start:529 stop:1584 length:1056 start_codon:yes stop_codon:yes gene_type:complete
MKKVYSKKNNNLGMNTDEKNRLKTRINTSVKAYIRKRRRIRYASLVAASVVLLFSIGISLNNYNSTSAIENFAKTLDLVNSNKNAPVQLVLNNDQNIEIEDDSAVIAYSKTGEEVSLGGSKYVNKNTSKDEKQNFNTLIVPYGKHSEILLSDGTKVWLNSGSKLVFPAKFRGSRRNVFIEGEGIFEVAHNKEQPFIVKSANHEVEVLGTVFSVSNYPNDSTIKTVLKSGSVQLNYKNDSFFASKKSLKITPGTMSVFSKNKKNIKTKSVAIEKYFSWQDGIFMFENDSFQAIVKKIARYYNVEITIEDQGLKKEIFSGQLDVNGTIDIVLKTLQLTAAFDYEMKNNCITIK